MNVLAIAVAYSLIFLLGESAVRLFRMTPGGVRPVIHVACGLLSTIAPIWLTRSEIIGLALFFTTAMLVSMRISLLRSIHGVERTSWGELFFPLGIALAAALYLPASPHLYTLSVLVLATSDPLANVLGSRAMGGRLLFGKSLLGSLVFFGSSLAICLVFLPALQALLVSTALTITEAISPFGSDNLTIVAAGAVAAIV